MVGMEPLEFSLCALYKNEEKNLETFLKRHINLFDEFVLVDTGSTDRSNEVVKDYGLDHYFFEWPKDFSIARNFSLTKPTKPYVAVLDMDEWVPEAEFLRLKEIIRETQKDVYSLRQINFVDDREDMNWKSIETLPQEFHEVAEGYIPSPLFRVFRNFKGVEFHGVIHELVGESVSRLKLSSKVTDVPIYHYGWIERGRSEEEKLAKKKAYKEMIQKAWKKDPSPKMAFYYIKSLDDPKEQIKLAYKMSKQQPGIKQFWEILSGNSAQLGQWERALSYAQKGLQHHPGNLTLLGTQVRCLNELQQPAPALALVEELLEKDRGNPAYWFEKFRALVMLNRVKEAKELTKQFPPHFPKDLAEQLMKSVTSGG